MASNDSLADLVHPAWRLSAPEKVQLTVLAKGQLYLVAPEAGVRSIAACTPERVRGLRWAGLPTTLLGLVVAGIALFR
ncbi:MAG: hypothetical protein AAF604_06425 [Acidobacteriota bacterium]